MINIENEFFAVGLYCFNTYNFILINDQVGRARINHDTAGFF